LAPVIGLGRGHGTPVARSGGIMAQRRNRRFAEEIPRARKRSAGRTRASETPLEIRVTGVVVPQGFRPRARAILGRRLGRFATHIERGSVRIESGPGGVADTVCRIQLTLSGRPSVVVEGRAYDAERALRQAVAAAASAMGSSLARARMRTPAPTHPRPSRPPVKRKSRARPQPEGGSLIGRRVGRAATNLRRAASRPEKERRDVWIDTAAPGVSETHRKAGGGSSAARNTKLRLSGMGYALEDSAVKPSRKSTRKSANRAKSGSKLARRQRRKTHAPKARAKRAQTGRQRKQREARA
jgi:hypothetical protein